MSSPSQFSLGEVRVRLSPNRDDRPQGRAPDLVVLHYTAMASAQAALDRLCDPAAKVSAHYLIARDGVVWGLAPEADRAWHAGVSSWAGGRLVNDRAIGVELDHPGQGEGLSPQQLAALGSMGAAPPFAEAQMAALERLLAAMLARWSMPPQAVLGHSDAAPGRKTDPGVSFDWRRLARQGLAVAAPVETMTTAGAAAGEADWPRFREAARAFGYGDWPDEALLDATRRRFRPAALGRPLEPADAQILEQLSASWPPTLRASGESPERQ